MDLLSSIIDQAGWRNDLIAHHHLPAPWGYRFPCDRSGGFHIVTRGRMFVRTAQENYSLSAGDILFLVRGLPHDLLSDSKATVKDIGQMLRVAPDEITGDVTSLVSIRYEVPDGRLHPLFLELPPVICVRHQEIPVGDPIAITLQMLALEMENKQGSHLILQRLTDILLYNVIRRELARAPLSSPGWSGALRDDRVTVALEHIHLRPQQDWTIASLARAAGISRASLAARFKSALGLTVYEYLSQLRLDKARGLLQNANLSLTQISREVGYSSPFALSKAYKRRFGRSPRG